MPMYQRRGQVPAKRHTQAWRDGVLLAEEVIGLEGFSGLSSILYHLGSPCRARPLGDFRPIAREEWVPAVHVHHLFQSRDLPSAGDALTGRRLLAWNDDLELFLCRPSEPMAAFYRNGEGDEIVFVHEGTGTIETILGDLPYRPGDYVVIPRGITHRYLPDPGPQRLLMVVTPSHVEIPRRYRNDYGQLVEEAPYHNRDFHAPGELRTRDERGEVLVTVRTRGGFQDYVLERHPFDVVGWDGYLFPWTFNIHDFEPLVKKVHAPPPVHQTFAAHNFVVCSFCPRPLDWHPQAVPIPYNHANLDSEELIYYVSGSFGSRRGVDVGSISLHPSGIPHGPQPGLAEESLGATFTDEVAVMVDTFRPLRLGALARELDDPGYATSWCQEPAGALAHLDALDPRTSGMAGGDR